MRNFCWNHVCGAIGAVAAVCVVFFSATAQAETKGYSVPDELRSGLWSVTADGQPVGVYSARTCDPPFDVRYDFGGEYAFAGLDLDSPVTLTIRTLVPRNLDAVRVLPASAGVQARRIDDSTLELRLEKPCKLSLEPNGREHPLLIFANAPETEVPDFSDPNVVVFRAGLHRPEGGRVDLRDGQTLYLEAGAVLQAGIAAQGKNIRICGRGVLDSSLWEWRKGPTGHVLELWKCQNLRVEGITIRGASHWTVVPICCDGVEIRDLKLCGGRVQNDDGINPCNSRNVHISECFIRTDDDCLALKGLDADYGNCENITVENCILWCDRARIVLMGHESRAPFMRNIRFENLEIIHTQYRVFLLEPGEEMRMEDVHVRGVHVESDAPGRTYQLLTARPTVNQYMRKQVPGHVTNCTFSDLTFTGVESPVEVLLEGKDAEHQAENVSLKNVRIFGVPMTSENGLKVGDFTKNVTNEP